MFVSDNDAELHQSGSAHLFHDGETRISERTALLGIHYACQAIERHCWWNRNIKGPILSQTLFSTYKKIQRRVEIGRPVVTKSGFGN